MFILAKYGEAQVWCGCRIKVPPARPKIYPKLDGIIVNKFYKQNFERLFLSRGFDGKRTNITLYEGEINLLLGF